MDTRWIFQRSPTSDSMNHLGKSARQAIKKGLIVITLLVGIAGLAVPAEARHLAGDNNPGIPPSYNEVSRASDSDLIPTGHQKPAPPAIETISRTVTVTIEVTVPEFTPGTVYIFGNQPELGDWDLSAVPMVQSSADVWGITLEFPEDTALAFSFGRGSQNTGEAEQDGNATVPARELTVTYGADGVQSAYYEVANWRDPIVIDHFPRDGASSLPIDSTFSVSWNQLMGVGTGFLVAGPGGPVSGSFTYYANTFTHVFEPTDLLNIGATYAITVAGQTDAGQDVQQVPVQFAFDTMVPTSVDLVVLAEKESITDSWWWVSWPWLMVLLTAVSLSGLVWIKRRRTVLAENR